MNAQKEIQGRYSGLLADCYELYRKGQRCLFDKIPGKSYDCNHCKHANRNKFCRTNQMLKKLIRLLAEGMSVGEEKDYGVSGATAAPSGFAADDTKPQGTPITDEHITSFRALNIAVALSSPNVKETIWLVPEPMGKDGLELTPEDLRILEAAATTFDARVVEASRIDNNQEEKFVPIK